jgi:6-phosphogluconolactonase
MRFRVTKRGQTGWGTPVLARPRDARALMRTFLAAGTGLAAAGALGGFAVPAQAASFPGAVYTMTNSPSGNAIEAFARDASGSLTPAGTYPTGGSGGTLGSGHSIVVSPDGHTVLAVNAGSNSISEFAATSGRLRRIATVASGGADPNSVTMHGDLVYVLNAGSGSIAGFRLSPHGLSVIPGSRRPLGAAAQLPRQIQFNRDGRVLVADEGGSSTIDTFLVAHDGAAGPAITTPSAGGGPFGFDFDRAGHLLVSDAALVTGQSGATSYDVARNGTVAANGPAVPSGQAAACWLAAAGRYAYTGNAGSGSIGKYAVAPDGRLTFLGSTLVGNNPASHPLDEGVSAGQHFLYVLAGGLAQIVGYRISNDGSLTQVTTVPVAAGAGGIGVS